MSDGRCYDIVEAVVRAPELALVLEKPRIARGVDLAAVEAAILGADDVDEIRRIRLLRYARALDGFYRCRRRLSSAA